MAILGKEALTRRTKYKTVNIPELEGDIRLCSLGADQIIELVQSFSDPNEAKSPSELLKLGFRLIAMCWVDAEGNRVLAEGEEHLLGNLPPNAIEPLCNAVYELNGMGEPKKN